MRSILKLFFHCPSFLATAAFLFAATPQREAGESATPVKHTTEQKALLQALDEQLMRFEATLAKDQSPAHAATVKPVLDTLKQRRDAFHRLAFDQGKYDELRFDLNVASQRLNLWLAPLITSRAAPKKANE